MENDPRSLNALGYIFANAPELLDKDISRKQAFGQSVQKDLSVAYKYFKKAAMNGSLNAKFNIGMLHLLEEGVTISGKSSDESIKFSFHKAY